MADQEMLRPRILNITSNIDPSQSTTIAERRTRKPLRVCDGEIKSDYSSWKGEVESYFVYYSTEYSRETDKISWMEGILNKKALHWHQARAQQLADLNVCNNWTAYWQAIDTQFRNEHEISEASQKLRDLCYKCDISESLVILKDLNRHVNASGQTFRDQVQSQILDDIIDIMFTIGLMLIDDSELLGVLEMVGKRIEKKKTLKGKDQRDGETKSHFFRQKAIQKAKEKPKNIEKIIKKLLKKIIILRKKRRSLKIKPK
jgi:hypothetical protein